jgi:hypothetical protein
MFPFNLFDTSTASSANASFRWTGGSSKPADGDIGLERFASLPGAEPVEISAAGLATSDLSQ